MRLISSFLFMILALHACEQDTPVVEKPGIITNLSGEDAYLQGILVTIHLDVAGEDLSRVLEVRISIDQQDVSVSHDFPCYFEWDSDSDTIGYHTVGLAATDVRGNRFLDEYPVRLYSLNDRPCPGAQTVRDWDGNIYGTIKIGDQCWMKENLKAIHYADGTPLVRGTGSTDTRRDTTIRFYFDYQDDVRNSDTFGRLYVWKAAVKGYSTELDNNPSNIQGVCPDGWHLPSDSEWKELEMYLGMSEDEAYERDWRGSIEGGMLKDTGTAQWYFPNTGATNESGFTALPSGYRTMEGTYWDLGRRASFWSSTNHIAANHTHNPAYRILQYDEARTWRYRGFHGYLSYARSVRCVKDEVNK
jgi:uncharacterized protein (TIGR02145 family)